MQVLMDNLIFTPVHVALFFSWFNFAAEGNSYEVIITAPLTSAPCRCPHSLLVIRRLSDCTNKCMSGASSKSARP